MSKFRLYSSYGSIAAMLTFATWITVGSFPLTGKPQVVADVAPNTPVPSPHQAPGQVPPVLRANVRHPAGIALQVPQALPRSGAVRGPSVPLPADPIELATGLVQPALSPADRAAAYALINRAAQNSQMHLKTMSPYQLSVSFTAGGTVEYTGSGELTETWANGQNWRWTSNLGGHSMVRLSSAGQIGEGQPISMVPMRVQMLRAAIFWSTRTPGPNAMIRTGQSQWNGKAVTCVLTSNMPPAATSARLWEEEEHCIDSATGLLQIYSVAPGVSMIYGYTRNQQFHGRGVPDQITIYVDGKVVLQAQVSLTDLGPVAPSIFAIPQNAGPPIMLASGVRFAQDIGDVSGTARPVIVHATISGQGKVLEEELCSAGDSALAQSALDIVKNTSFSPTGMTQREAYINVRFGN